MKVLFSGELTFILYLTYIAYVKYLFIEGGTITTNDFSTEWCYSGRYSEMQNLVVSGGIAVEVRCIYEIENRNPYQDHI